MQNHKHKVARTLLGVSAALLSHAALAITVTGATVSYDFYDFDTTDLGLFGTVSLSGGNNLVFAPTSFSASSANGVSGSAVQTLRVTVSANPGYQLSAINLTETGRYLLTGSASAFVTGNITARDIEGTTEKKKSANIATTSPLTVNGAETGWTANAGLTLPTTEGWGGSDNVINKIGLQVSNQLFATSVLGSSSDVWKTAVGLNVVTGTISPVPEAKTYAMLLAGLGMVGFMASRRSRILG